MFSKGTNTVIVAAKRTPIGCFMGNLSTITAPNLCSVAIRAALDTARLNPDQVDEVILGNVLSANIGQAPARQASLGAGLPIDVPCTLINKVCASGLKSLTLASQSIQLGISDTVVCGGMESMSLAPHYEESLRVGKKFGDSKLIDSITKDGLQDAYNGHPMGLCAEKTASDLNITRAVQDEYCIASYERALKAISSGYISEYIVPVKVSEKVTVSEDEEPGRFRKEKIPELRTAFSKNGTITAANSSKINDGACALIAMSEKKALSLGLKPLARIVSYADAEVEPVDFCISPSKSSQIALERAGLKASKIDYHEINEAFSVTTLANMKVINFCLKKNKNEFVLGS
jgi:acetyl-CoA C-acetyltransferase